MSPRTVTSFWLGLPGMRVLYGLHAASNSQLEHTMLGACPTHLNTFRVPMQAGAATFNSLRVQRSPAVPTGLKLEVRLLAATVTGVCTQAQALTCNAAGVAGIWQRVNHRGRFAAN